MERVSTTFSDNLELLNEKHSERTEYIRNNASNCLDKDYMVSSAHLISEVVWGYQVYKIMQVPINEF
jgi:hypothetical protein